MVTLKKLMKVFHDASCPPAKLPADSRNVEEMLKILGRNNTS
jgi:ferritin-like protein